ncbi:hypothetical protein H0N96_02525, partial [Candidatus Micrarchaeota archaeon]|nr:hypothetical protein [Candidatus Micrarchaeota archaeon]
NLDEARDILVKNREITQKLLASKIGAERASKMTSSLDASAREKSKWVPLVLEIQKHVNAIDVATMALSSESGYAPWALYEKHSARRMLQRNPSVDVELGNSKARVEFLPRGQISFERGREVVDIVRPLSMIVKTKGGQRIVVENPFLASAVARGLLAEDTRKRNTLEIVKRWLPAQRYASQYKK